MKGRFCLKFKYHNKGHFVEEKAVPFIIEPKWNEIIKCFKKGEYTMIAKTEEDFNG